MRDVVDLDRFDLKMLAALQEDGRLTNQELADRVGLSASQCSRRRSALEARGVVRGYRAVLSAESLGLGVTVFTHVTLARHSPGNAQRFFELMRGLDFVLEAHSLTGDADYLVKMVVPDLKSLSTLINDHMLAHDSVESIRSAIVLETLKAEASLPLNWVRPAAGSAG